VKAILEKKCAHPIAAAYCVVGKKADLATFMEKLEAIKQNASEKDVVILFFSVHGGTDEDGNFSVSLADKHLTGETLARAFDEIEGNVIILIDTCGAGGMLNHCSANPNVCVLLGCGAHEETGGGKRNPLHGYYANAIYAAFSGAGDRDKDGTLTLAALDRYLLEPRSARGSKHQHAVSSVPRQMATLRIVKP